MKRKALGVMVAVAATAPAIVLPQLVAPAHAQNAAPVEFPDVKTDHWAYAALNKLSQAGIIEGNPDGNFYGSKPMTRYEFAVAIARLLQNMPKTGPAPDVTKAYVDGEIARLQGLITRLQTEKLDKPGPAPGKNYDADIANLQKQINDLKNQPGYQLPGDVVRTNQIGNFATKQELATAVAPLITRKEVNDLIKALRDEFAGELQRLGVKVDSLDKRVTALENKVPPPPKTTMSLSLLHRLGTFAAISSTPVGNHPGTGRGIVNPAAPGGANAFTGPFVPTIPGRTFASRRQRAGEGKFSYTDAELRLTDRISDRLSATAALRSLSNTQEDPWAGDTAGGLYLREAYAVVDLSDKKTFLVKNLSAVLGRQRTKIAQGLVYDNDLAPSDQLHLAGNIGPVKLSAFTGSNDGSGVTGGALGFAGVSNPYLTTGANGNLGVAGNPDSGFFAAGDRRRFTGAVVGFAGTPAFGLEREEGNELAVHAAINLFKINGKPLSVGATRLVTGVQLEEGYSFDATIPLFKRNIGVEYAVKNRYFGGLSASGVPGGKPSAYNITLPALRTKLIDLDLAYGSAEDGFEYFSASSANPYARTYAESVFDRPLALGAPLINGGGVAGNNARYLAAKQAFDVSGTVRVPIAFLRHTPIDFRWYTAKGTGGVDLGDVYTVGSTFNVTPGFDLELKYGFYNVAGPTRGINMFRVGANVGF